VIQQVRPLRSKSSKVESSHPTTVVPTEKRPGWQSYKAKIQDTGQVMVIVQASAVQT
jgi:hypothetical protein